MTDSDFGPMPYREAPEEKIHRLRKEAEAIKKALLKKDQEDIKKGTKSFIWRKMELEI